jgi:hypothetical protein
MERLVRLAPTVSRGFRKLPPYAHSEGEPADHIQREKAGSIPCTPPKTPGPNEQRSDGPSLGSTTRRRCLKRASQSSSSSNIASGGLNRDPGLFVRDRRDLRTLLSPPRLCSDRPLGLLLSFSRRRHSNVPHQSKTRSRGRWPELFCVTARRLDRGVAGKR